MIHRLALIAGKRFVAPAKYDAAYPSALAVWCSDGRFTKAVEDLLRGDGEARFDTLTLPGGPALFTGRSASPSDLDTMKTSAEFLISAHKIAHVVLIAHENCGYYQRLLGPLATDSSIKTRQVEDVRRAATALRRLRPELQIDGWYASVASGKVAFDPLSVEVEWEITHEDLPDGRMLLTHAKGAQGVIDKNEAERARTKIHSIARLWRETSPGTRPASHDTVHRHIDAFLEKYFTASDKVAFDSLEI